jgi:hypothetical protein
MSNAEESLSREAARLALKEIKGTFDRFIDTLRAQNDSLCEPEKCENPSAHAPWVQDAIIMVCDDLSATFGKAFDEQLKTLGIELMPDDRPAKKKGPALRVVK